MTIGLLQIAEDDSRCLGLWLVEACFLNLLDDLQ
jgi:hypothetical protein